MNQRVRFCTAPDGVRIAYATSGNGPPLVKTANWLTHLEYDWESPVWKHLFRGLSADHLLLRYDDRGNGLSDWDAVDISFEAWIRDLEVVVDSAGLERFALLGISRGSAIAIEYAARHPERVSHLILLGGYCRGGSHRTTGKDADIRQAMVTLMRDGWGRDNPAFRQLWTSTFVPDGTVEQQHWFNELQRRTTSPENAVRMQHASDEIDVAHRLPTLQVPTLVCHARGDAVVKFDHGRRMAAAIPHATFVPLESRNHLLLAHEPAFHVFVSEFRRFMGTAPDDTGAQAAPDPVRPTLLPGTFLGRYVIEARIGRGGMGIVHRATDPHLERSVAIKVLPPDLTRDERAMQRFLQEARAASALDHPNICTIHEINETEDGQLYLVMAHYEGETLKDRIGRGLPKLEDAIDIATQVGEGLAEAHRAGIVHRDIKPANLFITRPGAVKILDFGLAKLASTEDFTQTGTVGTLSYMSPEQARGGEVDHRTDIWSLGVVLYEMLAGQPPFQGKNVLALADAIRTSEPEELTGAASLVSPVVKRALRKDPATRYQTVTALLADLRDVERGRTPA